MRRMHSASYSGLGLSSSLAQTGEPAAGYGRLCPSAMNYTADGLDREAQANPGQNSALSFSISKESLQKITKWAVQSPQGDLWPETCKLHAATVGRILPSPLPIRRFFKNAVTRPQSVASLAVRQRRATQGGGSGYRSAPSQGTPVICSGCGQPTTVPFEPRGDRPVYCRDCYTARKGSGGGGSRGRDR